MRTGWSKACPLRRFDAQEILTPERTIREKAVIPNQASNKDKTEGLHEAESGISNWPLAEEEARRENVPPRGEAREGSHA